MSIYDDLTALRDELNQQKRTFGDWQELPDRGDPGYGQCYLANRAAASFAYHRLNAILTKYPQQPMPPPDPTRKVVGYVYAGGKLKPTDPVTDDDLDEPQQPSPDAAPADEPKLDIPAFVHRVKYGPDAAPATGDAPEQRYYYPSPDHAAFAALTAERDTAIAELARLREALAKAADGLSAGARTLEGTTCAYSATALDEWAAEARALLQGGHDGKVE